jgi:hypothetical protein
MIINIQTSHHDGLQVLLDFGIGFNIDRRMFIYDKLMCWVG